MVSAFCSVWLDPLLVLVSLQLSSQPLTVIDQTGCFAVDVLAAHQQALAQCSASSPERSFAELAAHPSRPACPCDSGVS